jgi:hypothetical protein
LDCWNIGYAGTAAHGGTVRYPKQRRNGWPNTTSTSGMIDMERKNKKLPAVQNRFEDEAKRFKELSKEALEKNVAIIIKKNGIKRVKPKSKKLGFVVEHNIAACDWFLKRDKEK